LKFFYEMLNKKTPFALLLKAIIRILKELIP
jgi:hypothetical protein